MAITVDFSDRINLAYNIAVEKDRIGINTQSGANWRRILGVKLNKDNDEPITKITFKISAEGGKYCDSGERYNWFIGIHDRINSDNNTAEDVINILNTTNFKTNFFQGSNGTFDIEVTLDKIYWKEKGIKYLYIGNDISLGSNQIAYFTVTNVSILNTETSLTDFQTRANIIGMTSYVASTQSAGIYNNYDSEYLGWQYENNNTNTQVIKFFVPKLHGPINEINIQLYMKGQQKYTSPYDKCYFRWAISSSDSNLVKYIDGGLITANEDNNQIAYGESYTEPSVWKYIEINVNDVSLNENTNYYLILYPHLERSKKPTQSQGHYAELSVIDPSCRHSITLNGKLEIPFILNHYAEGFKYLEGNGSNKMLLESISLNAPYGEPFYLKENQITPLIPRDFKFTKWTTPENSGTIFPDDPIYDSLVFDKNAEYSYNPIDYEISYNLNGGDLQIEDKYKTYNILYGPQLNIAPIKKGYTFNGWESNGQIITELNYSPISRIPFNSLEELNSFLSTRATGNQNLSASWTVNQYTYKVKHISYSGKLIELEESDDFIANFGETIIIKSKNFEHYEERENGTATQDEDINGIEYPISYFPKYYNLDLFSFGSLYETISYTIEELPVLPILNRQGYKFLGWGPSTSETFENPFEFPAESAGIDSIYAHWEPQYRDYTVEHYFQNTEGEYKKEDEEKGKALFGTVLNLIPKDEPGFIYSHSELPNSEGQIQETNNIFKLYYSRIIYNIYIAGIEEAVVEDYYGKEISITIPEDINLNPWQTYEFEGLKNYSVDSTNKIITLTIPNGDYTLDLSNPINIVYTVIYDIIDENNTLIPNIQGNKQKNIITIEYEYGDEIILPKLTPHINILNPTFEGWYCVQEDKIYEPQTLINRYGNYTFIAQIIYDKEYYGSGKVIYVKTGNNTETKWEGAIQWQNKKQGGENE